LISSTTARSAELRRRLLAEAVEARAHTDASPTEHTTASSASLRIVMTNFNVAPPVHAQVR